MSPTQSPGRTASGAVSGNLNATSTIGAPLSYSLAEGPASGAVTLSQDGTYTYTPNASLASAGGTDSFRVTIGEDTSAYRLTGIGGAIQGILSALATAFGMRQPDTVTVTVPVSVVGNAAPVAGTLVVGTPDPVTGIVLGQATATDPDGNLLSYSAPATTTKGAVTINASTGAFSYTPSVIARHYAAQDGATADQTTDNFNITISDGTGRTTSVPVTVSISSTNSPPTIGAVTVGSPNSYGTVLVTVSATDAEGDSLVYGPATTAKGSVFRNEIALDGVLVYSPSASALSTASAPNATLADKTDSFVITINDQHGGVVAVPVTVAIGSVVDNKPPFAENVTVGSPDPATGVVSGQINAISPNGHALTYDGTARTTKGTVVVDVSTGSFSYAPTSAARQIASAPTATAADKTDSFTVTVTDGHGGSTAVLVTVEVSPFTSMQGSETYSVGTSIPVGMYPQKITVSPTGRSAYVTNLLSNSVSVFDTISNTVIAEIAVGSSPGPLAVNSGGTRLYVGNQDGNSLSVINTSTNSVIATIGVGARPSEIAVSPNGSRVYVTNWYGGTVSVIDATTNALVDTIVLWTGQAGGLSSPSGLALSPDGSKLYVGGSSSSGSPGNGRLSVIDTATTKVIQSFYVPDAVTSLTISPSGSRLYLGGTSVSVAPPDLLIVSRVTVVATSDYKVVTTVPTGNSFTELAISPDGTRLYATGQQKSVTVVDTNTNQVVTTFGVANNPNGLVVSRDGTRIYVAIEGSGIDPAGANTISVITRSV